MEADLFSASDAAALLAIRKVLDKERLSGDALYATFSAAGLMLEPDEAGSPPMHALVDDRTGERRKRAT